MTKRLTEGRGGERVHWDGKNRGRASGRPGGRGEGTAAKGRVEQAERAGALNKPPGMGCTGARLGAEPEQGRGLGR